MASNLSSGASSSLLMGYVYSSSMTFSFLSAPIASLNLLAEILTTTERDILRRLEIKNQFECILAVLENSYKSSAKMRLYPRFMFR